MDEQGIKRPDDSEDEAVYLYYPLDYVIHTWLDHRIGGAYPAPGGYDAQDAQLMDDWHTLNKRHLYISNQLRNNTTLKLPASEDNTLDFSEL